MNKTIKRVVRRLCILLLATVTALSALPASALKTEWDGYNSEESEAQELELIDFDNTFSILEAGTAISQEYTQGYRYSAHWNHNSSLHISFKGMPRDWTPYDTIEVWIYAENAENTQFVMMAVCDQMETSGSSYHQITLTVQDGWNQFRIAFDSMTITRSAVWDKMNSLEFTVNGWGMTPSPEADYYIASAKLSSSNRSDGGLIANYDLNDIETAEAALQNAVAVVAGSSNILNCGTIGEEKMKVIEKDGKAMVPLAFFETYLEVQTDASGSTATLTAGETQLTIQAGETTCRVNGQEKTLTVAPELMDGALYLPAEDCALLLGSCAVSDGKLTVISPDDSAKVFRRSSQINVLSEIAAYLTAYVSIDPESVTEEDYGIAKDNWRYELVGDETLDTDDVDIAKKIETIQADGIASWRLMHKETAMVELFSDTPMTTSTNLTSAYQHLYNMAAAYSTYGSALYGNERIKNDILFGLEWMYQNRYGEAEMNGTGWRDPAAFNWWDWQIGAPLRLINTMMLMEEFLTDQQIANYLKLFDKLVPAPSMTGANRIWVGRLIIGSGLLQKDAERVLTGRDGVDSVFLYVDNGRNSGEGFYTDGSYRFHGAHAMNGTYGLEMMQEIGPFLNILNGSIFTYSNPQAYNAVDWLFSGFEPLIYKGAMMRMVNGRYPDRAEHALGCNFVGVALELLSFANETDQERIKSMVKYQVSEDTTQNYYDSLSLVQAAKLKEIMNDASVKPRENYILNKVYYNMDKVVHQREDYAVGVSMSSSRMYNYESINSQNMNGWYLSDGMTVMYTDDLNQYDLKYWASVDPYRLPGITADTQEREEVSVRQGYEYKSNKDFVGGVTLDDEFGVCAMWLESYHADAPIGTLDDSYGGPNPAHDCSLEAQKAWFFFDDEVVALGTGIHAQDDATVLTVVENRKSNHVVEREPTAAVNTPYEIVGVQASQIPEEENIPENTYDDNLDTKWAALDEAEITWDLGEVKQLGHIGLAFLYGSTRKQIFDLEVSTDGKQWTQVFSGRSSGNTENLEAYDLKGLSGRYVKLKSHGASNSKWLSLSEAVIYPPGTDGKFYLGLPEYIGTETVTVDGATCEVSGEDYRLENAGWVHLEGTGGYYFPSGGNLLARKTSKEPSFFELWFDHGVNPDNEMYAYTLLPGKSVEQTAAYAQSPDISVLCNTPQLQVVRENKLGITGMVFWQAGTWEDITVSQPMIVMVRQQGEKFEISASDPTQKLEEAVITIGRNLTPQSLDEKISVSGEEETILTIDTKGAMGRSFGGFFRQ